jgi:histone-binding protein RBBP4
VAPGVQTDGSVPNTLVVAHVEVPRPHVAEAESMQSFNYAARSPLVRKYKTMIHPGEVRTLAQLRLHISQRTMSSWH